MNAPAILKKWCATLALTAPYTEWHDFSVGWAKQSVPITESLMGKGLCPLPILQFSN